MSAGHRETSSRPYFLLQIGNRDVQVIPWALRDIEWGRENASPRANCIFVGGLHGETTAEHVKIIMEENFGQVQHVLIDTDRYRFVHRNLQLKKIDLFLEAS